MGLVVHFHDFMLLPLCFVEKALGSLELLFGYVEAWRSERFWQLLTTFPFDHGLLAWPSLA